MLEWSLPEDAEIDRSRVVKAGQPASWITPQGLRSARQRLPELAYRRFVANQWTEREGHWLPPDAWRACIGQPEFEPGERIWAGIDIGGERSASAIAWVTERLHVGCAIYHGDGAVLEVADHIRELARTCHLVELTADPMRAGQLLAELERERLPVSVFPQTDQRMIPASSRLHAAITERRITLPDDLELRGARSQHDRPPQSPWLAHRLARARRAR